MGQGERGLLVMTKTKTIESKRKANKQLLSKLFVYKAFVKMLKKKRSV